ncbi:Der GTPase-activating protein YihI [Thalassotalea agarivorans]|uniref:Der GTPase-activating protein YihI n=1 Tax=Thalassotalea agarivorans TaxID=349064 RepID=A0A1I0CQS0_THASX|nr:Der GTPase-activating protein YihI [Thalassotalea agarivorans]SET22006.1 hypothetical protein SAMN05660429_01293 [Thalassotalea agarivorans]
MTRKKKSRKPGAGSSGVVKASTLDVRITKDKKPKKKTGKPAGTRQLEGQQKAKPTQTAQGNKDARVGSKKPIDLGIPNVQVKAPKKAKQVDSPIAKIKVVDTGPSIQAQLDAIEQDPRLLDILDKQEQDISLSEQEVDLYNELMEQHEQLSAQLTPEEDAQDTELSEDDLWDKLDNDDLSRFQ